MDWEKKGGVEIHVERVKKQETKVSMQLIEERRANDKKRKHPRVNSMALSQFAKFVGEITCSASDVQLIIAIFTYLTVWQTLNYFPARHRAI